MCHASVGVTLGTRSAIFTVSFESTPKGVWTDQMAFLLVWNSAHARKELCYQPHSPTPPCDNWDFRFFIGLKFRPYFKTVFSLKEKKCKKKNTIYVFC